MEFTAESRETVGVPSLARKLGFTWKHLEQARRAADFELQKLRATLSQARLIPEDTGFVVFGSLARGEWTSGSDLDWTLLVDGSVDDGHVGTTHRIRATLHGYKDPGRAALFGGLAISHELVHRIGGESDSNRNITQRILLLLESRSPQASDLVRTRVLRVLLTRYLADDLGYPMLPRAAERAPRFLLNDIVRYWRTMCVDFAAKRSERAGHGWGLRNFKLRMSRKLLFTAGLAACLGCRLRPPRALSQLPSETKADYSAIVAEHLLEFANRTPLDTVAWLAAEFGADEQTVDDIFGSYDAFLGILGDAERRRHLDGLAPDDAAGDPLFRETRDVGERFQRGLTRLFFATDAELTAATHEYGIF